MHMKTFETIIGVKSRRKSVGRHQTNVRVLYPWEWGWVIYWVYS